MEGPIHTVCFGEHTARISYGSRCVWFDVVWQASPHWATQSRNSSNTQQVECFINTSRMSGRGHRMGPVFVCVCPSVSTLLAEPFDVQTINLTCRSAWTISRPSLMDKVVSQRSRSPGEKMWFSGNSTGFFLIRKAWYKILVYHVMLGHLATSQLSRCHVTSQNDIIQAKGL